MLRPTGALTVFTARAVLEQGRALIQRGAVDVDFAEVSETDSVALALVFDWLRAAQREGHALKLRNVPATLVSLAELYGVTDLLPIQA